MTSSNLSLSDGLSSSREPRKPFLRTATCSRRWPSTVTVAIRAVNGLPKGASWQSAPTRVSPGRVWVRIASQSAAGQLDRDLDDVIAGEQRGAEIRGVRAGVDQAAVGLGGAGIVGAGGHDQERGQDGQRRARASHRRT
jgi:hypothetical protein